MGKPTVILADTDESYLAQLELKFLQELGEEVQLVVITDAAYFESFFSTPQAAAALVLDEKLWTEQLRRHSIDKVFVLGEQPPGQTENLSYYKIFKYSSTRDIYNEVMYYAGIATGGDAPVNQARLVVVYSPAGGAGKTTVAMGLCATLGKMFKRTLYINAQYLNTFQHRLKNRGSLPVDACGVLRAGGAGLYSGLKHHVRSEGFHYLPPLPAALPSLDIPFSAYQALACQARDSQDYDYVIVDTESALTEGVSTLLSAADKLVLLVGQTGGDIYGVDCLLESIDCRDSDKTLFVCNRFDAARENGLVHQSQTLRFIVNEYIEDTGELKDSAAVQGNLPGLQKLARLLV